MISHEHKCIFIHITKCAGKSVEQAFGLDLKHWHQNPTRVKHGTPHDWEYPQYWADYFTFTIIRNPLARAVSAFFFDYGRRDRRHGATKAALYATGGSFDVFVRNVLPQFANERSIFWPQSRWLDADYDYIARVETLREDWPNICASVGLSVDLPHINRSAHDEWRAYYEDKDTEQRVRAVYASDFDKLQEFYA